MCSFCHKLWHFDFGCVVFNLNHCKIILLSHFKGLCDLQSINLSTVSPFSLVDSNHDLDALQDCIWLFTASSSYRVVLRPILFIIHKSNVFSIGHGHNPGNTSSLILTRYKDSLPSHIVSESTTLWMKTLDLEYFDQFAQYIFEVDQLSELGMYNFILAFDNHYNVLLPNPERDPKNLDSYHSTTDLNNLD